MQLTRMMQYKRWANDLLFSCVATVPPKRLVEPHPIVFGNLINTLNHVLTVDLIFKAHLTDTQHGFTTRRPQTSPVLAELARHQLDVDSWYINYAQKLPTPDREDVVEFEFVGGGEGAMTRNDILLHVVNHGTYHRGHVGTMLYNMSVMPPTTDYPVFVRDAADR